MDPPRFDTLSSLDKKDLIEIIRAYNNYMKRDYDSKELLDNEIESIISSRKK